MLAVCAPCARVRKVFKCLDGTRGMDMDGNVFVEKKINEINPASDTKVRVLGTVVGRADDSGSIFIDDGTGAVPVVVGQDAALNVSENQLVRVFGRVRSSGDGFGLHAEIIQDMSKLNVKLYNAVMGYYSKMG